MKKTKEVGIWESGEHGEVGKENMGNEMEGGEGSLDKVPTSSKRVKAATESYKNQLCHHLEVRDWIDSIARDWKFKRIIPSHFAAPVNASRSDFLAAFGFLDLLGELSSISWSSKEDYPRKEVTMVKKMGISNNINKSSDVKEWHSWRLK
ncbi:lysine--tRNA ligase [Tanacetum coccineum]